jgi:glyoxylase-like metal-dependent hydrolase (beta-lactamase superfamily II)
LQSELKRLGIHRLVVPVPFPVEPLNVYFIEEPVPTLIDTPPKGRSFLKLLEERLDALGYRIADIRRIILTHPHFDHYGLARDIVARSGAEVCAPAGTDLCFRADSIEEDEKFQQDLLLKADAPEQWIEYVKHKFGGWARRYGCDIIPSQYLKHGCTVEIGPDAWVVTSAPGHTPWCILIHDPDSHVAFTGDFLLQNISSNPIVQRPSVIPKGYGSLKALISSLKKARNMGLQLVLPGHGELIEDPNTRIDLLIQFIEERKALVYDIVSSGPQTLFRMVKKLFPRLRRYELFLAVSELIGHLEVLEEEGRVIWEETDNRIIVSKA